MNKTCRTLGLAAGALGLAAAQLAFAHTVNQCIDGKGRKVMTDRPCENPETERQRDQTRKVQGVGVE